MESSLSFLVAFGPLLIVLVILALVLLFVVRPLVRLAGDRAGLERRMAERKKPLSKAEVDALAEELEASLARGKPTLSDQERITRLAQSDPEKAKELVRRWLRQ